MAVGVVGEDFPAHLTGLRAGSVVAGYRLEAPLGAGGMAVVFRARDERLGRLVALKVLAPMLATDDGFRRRFIAESRAAAAVDDPHIIPVYEAGEAGGVLYIAMRLVVGGDLRGVLAREGALSPGRAAGFISPAASALDAAHRAGLVHRDVKPANILVDARPDRPEHVYLSDFGVSKTTSASLSLTGTGVFLGTPDYSAPEQVQGRAVDGRADQYALACVAFQLLAGAAPFERDQGMAVLFAHLSEPPPSLGSRRPGLPGAADRVLARGMAKEPQHRYGSCREFADALREALGLESYVASRAVAAPARPHVEIATPPRFATPDALAGGAREQVTGGQEDDRTTAGARWLADDLPTEVSKWPPPLAGAPGLTPPGLPAERSADDLATTPVPGRRLAGRAVPRRVAVIAAAVGAAVIGLVAAIVLVSSGHSTHSTNVASRGQTHGPVSGPPSGRRWVYTTQGPVYGNPTVSGGVVYVGSFDSNVYALDAGTGHVRWTYTTQASIDSTPAVAGGVVYVGSSDHKVYALDAATGQVRWTYTTGAAVGGQGTSIAMSGPAVAGGVVYVGSDDSKVYALDAATGRVRWTYTTGFYVEARPAVAGGTVYISSLDNSVYALDAATGHVRWTYATGDSLYSGPAVAGGAVYVGSDDHKVYALDAATGHLRWTYTTGDQVDSSPAVAGGFVYIGSEDGKVYALGTAGP